MVGPIKGFCNLLKTKIEISNPRIVFYIGNLWSLARDVKSVLEQVVSVVIHIRLRPLKSRLFKQVYNSMESKYECLLLNTEVKWLSIGKVLNCVYDLKKERFFFFKKKVKILLSNIMKTIYVHGVLN